MQVKKKIVWMLDRVLGPPRFIYLFFFHHLLDSFPHASIDRHVLGQGLDRKGVKKQIPKKNVKRKKKSIDHDHVNTSQS